MQHLLHPGGAGSCPRPELLSVANSSHGMCRTAVSRVLWQLVGPSRVEQHGGAPGDGPGLCVLGGKALIMLRGEKEMVFKGCPLL